MTRPPHRHTLEIRNLSVRAGGIEILSGIDADVRCGEVTALVGPNGAGKTTLLLAILGLVDYTGEVRFCRADEHGRGAPRIGYVPQRLDFDRNAPMTVLDFFALSSQRRPVVLGRSRPSTAAARESLARAGAAHLADRPLGRLSGGELQRVLLALALRDSPDILLLDEPVSGVDAAGEELFCDFLDQIHSESRFSLLLVSHDLSVVSRHADRVICLNRRIVCQGATTETLTPENLAAMYGSGAHLFSHGHADGHGHLHDEGHGWPGDATATDGKVAADGHGRPSAARVQGRTSVAGATDGESDESTDGQVAADGHGRPSAATSTDGQVAADGHGRPSAATSTDGQVAADAPAGPDRKAP